MTPTFTPKTYQDVKANLCWYMTVVTGALALVVYYFLLPTEHQTAIENFFSKVSSSKAVSAIGVGGVGALLGWLMIFVLEIHDKIYDRHFVRWRHYYDLDFILPMLTRPFPNHLDPRFLAEAEKQPYKFMKPYYHFVADGSHEHAIHENTLIRFYEAATKYWVCQINEILIVLTYLLVTGYFVFYWFKEMPVMTVAIWLQSLILTFVVNRLLSSIVKRSVRRATLDEIEEIHDRFPNELQDEFKTLHQKMGLSWRP